MSGDQGSHPSPKPGVSLLRHPKKAWPSLSRILLLEEGFFSFPFVSFIFLSSSFFFFFWPCLFLKGIPVQILSDRDAMGKITRCMCFPPPRGRYTYSVKYLLKCVYFKPKQFFKEKILFCCCCCCSISEKYMTTGCSFWFLLTSNRCLCLSREQQEQKEEEQWGKKGKLIGRGFK